MNGYKLIEDAYQRGMTASQVYREYTKYFNLFRKFIDLTYFGVMGRDADGELCPVHVNGKNTAFGGRRQFMRSDVLCHFNAEVSDPVPQFRFLVGSPSSRCNLLCLDFDGDDFAITHKLACDLYLDLFSEYMPYIEPSRNRKGCYVWLLVERTSEPADFNALCNALSSILRLRYHDLGNAGEEDWSTRRSKRKNYFDGIKGTLHYDTRDIISQVDASNWQDDHRGLLVTFPLAGCCVQPDGDHFRRCFHKFVRQKKDGSFVNAIPERHLRDILMRLSPSTAASLIRISIGDKKMKKQERTSPKQLGSGGSPSDRWNQLLVKAGRETNPQARMRYASCLYRYQHGRYARDEDELVAYYEHLNLNTSYDKHSRRRHRAQEALVKHKSDPLPEHQRIIFEPEEWLPLIHRHVTDDVRRNKNIKYGYPVDDELLAAGLCLFTTNAMKTNRVDRMHTCGQEAQIAFYERLQDTGRLKAKFGDKNKRVAVVKLLQLAGLIVLRDGNHKYGGAKDGVADRFGLGPNHPRFDEFVRLYGDVRDPNSLPVTGIRLQPAMA